MIIGRFGGSSQRPYVEGRVSIPSQNISADISFVLDTGADMTVLMPMDGAKIGLDYNNLNNVVSSLGISGYSQDFLVSGYVTFRGSDGTLYSYEIDLLVSSPSPEISSIPSLLGRNIMNKWAIRYDPTNAVLEASVHAADSII